jgi:uncharacterized phage-associated protein
MSAQGIATPPAGPFSAAAVANEFLTLGRAEGVPIDQMKLQKLLFYGHAWYLAMNDTPLFEEEIEAWPWGPVVRSIYYETVGSGRAPVTSDMTALEKMGTGPLNFRLTTPRLSDDLAKSFVKAVWDSHKQFTGVQLSNSTHAVGEPWTIVKDQYGNLDNKPPIPNELIKEVCRTKLTNATAARANTSAS